MLSTIAGLPFLRDYKFWFALLGAFVMFSPRFGLSLSAQEVGALNVVLAAAFGVELRTSAIYVQTVMLNHKLAVQMKEMNEKK